MDLNPTQFILRIYNIKKNYIYKKGFYPIIPYKAQNRISRFVPTKDAISYKW